MSAQHHPGLHPPDTLIAPVRDGGSTISSALALLGHRCPGGCPVPATTLPVGILFLRRRGASSGSVGLLVLDLPERLEADWPAQLLKINACVRADRIRVLGMLRSPDDVSAARWIN